MTKEFCIGIKPFIHNQLLEDLSQIRKELLLFDHIFIPHFKETLGLFNLLARIKTGVDIQSDTLDELLMYYENKYIIDSASDFPSKERPVAQLTPPQAFSLELAQGMPGEKFLDIDIHSIVEKHAFEQEELMRLYSLTYGESWDINILPIVREIERLNPRLISKSDIRSAQYGLKHKSEEFPEIPDVTDNRRRLVVHISFDMFPTLSQRVCLEKFKKVRAKLKEKVLSLRILISTFARDAISLNSLKTEIERSINAIESSFEVLNLEFHRSRVGFIVSSSWEVYNEYRSFNEKSNNTGLDINFHILLMQRPCEEGKIKAYCINDFN